MNTKTKMHQYVIFIKPRKLDTADIKCLTVSPSCSFSKNNTKLFSFVEMPEKHDIFDIYLK